MRSTSGHCDPAHVLVASDNSLLLGGHYGVLIILTQSLILAWHAMCDTCYLRLLNHG